MATFFVLNHKKYRTSVRCADGRLEAVRFEPEVYFGGVGESTYTTSDPAIIDALHEHPAYQVTFWEKATITTAPIEETTPGNPATDLETYSRRCVQESRLPFSPDGTALNLNKKENHSCIAS